MKKIKRAWIVVGVIVLILIITNPTPQEFKEYMGYPNNSLSIRRAYNFIIFSIYINKNDYDKHYLAVFKNFFSVGYFND
jgi:hypothetical protein